MSTTAPELTTLQPADDSYTTPAAPTPTTSTTQAPTWKPSRTASSG